MLLKMRESCGRRGRDGRSKLIDEVCEMCGYERKYAIRVLGGKLPVAGAEKAHRGGPRRRYGDEAGVESDLGWRPSSLVGSASRLGWDFRCRITNAERTVWSRGSIYVGVNANKPAKLRIPLLNRRRH